MGDPKVILPLRQPEGVDPEDSHAEIHLCINNKQENGTCGDFSHTMGKHGIL